MICSRQAALPKAWIVSHSFTQRMCGHTLCPLEVLRTLEDSDPIVGPQGKVAPSSLGEPERAFER